MNTQNKICFLVLSCDKYSDLWEPFAQLFERYWPDCPFDKYFASNQISFNQYGFQSILMGEDTTWSQGLHNALMKLHSQYDYVLVTLEDLFLMRKVNTEYILNCTNDFIQLNGNYLRLYSRVPPHDLLNQYFGTLRKNAKYRCNCVYALWNISTLLDMLVLTENAWEFEKIGCDRVANLDGFFCVNHTCFQISNTVVKGKWIRKELTRVKKEIPDLIVKRELLSFFEEIKLKLYRKIFNFYMDHIALKFSKKIR